MPSITKAEIEKRVQAASKNQRIACKTALALADELGVSPRKIGDAANNLKIRISGCQLGCFK